MNKLLPNELLNEIVLFIPLKALRNGNHLGISANFMHLFAFIRYELLIVEFCRESLVRRSGMDFGGIYAFFEAKAATKEWSGTYGLTGAEQAQFLNYLNDNIGMPAAKIFWNLLRQKARQCGSNNGGPRGIHNPNKLIEFRMYFILMAGVYLTNGH